MPYKSREVAKQKHHEYYLKNKERILERAKRYIETHREAHRATCIRWNERNKEKMDEYYAQWRKDNPEKIRLKDEKYKDSLRDECFAAYGNRCVCCGEDRKEFFAMHHMDEDGARHRKEEKKLRQSAGIHKWLKEHSYPPNFCILCHNCNSARQYYGYCPHERELEAGISVAC